MKTILNITNGDSAVEIMQTAGVPGFWLPWRDVLHEGPVPADLSLGALSEVRARFISGRGWAALDEVRRSFAARDEVLESAEHYHKVVLWFEHDLYDQLQILQILDWFHANPHRHADLSIICTDNYLGELSAADVSALFAYQKPVTEALLALGSRAWAAFRSPDPAIWYRLLDSDTSALPYLRGAVHRMLEEYPDSETGLSRTAFQALKIIAAGEHNPARVFGDYQRSEERRFMGDASFQVVLEELLSASQPLLDLDGGEKLTLRPRSGQRLGLTALGNDVLAGRRNWCEIGGLDRWLGGVHLTPANPWYWDADGRLLLRKP